MVNAEVLKSELNANQIAIENKEAEVKAYISEKETIVSDLSKLQNSVIPAQQTKISNLQTDLKKAIENYNVRVNDAIQRRSENIKVAELNLKKAKDLVNQTQANYNTINSQSNLWSARFNDGCKWKGAIGGWQGWYAGDYARICTHKNRTKHDYNQNAPSYCLWGSERKKRQEYAKGKAVQWANEKNNAFKVLNSAKSNYDKKAIDKTNAEKYTIVDNAKANRTDIVSVEKAISDAKTELQGITGVDGSRSKLQKRISFIDGKITTANSELKALENERSITEVKYKEILSQEAQKLAIIREKEKEAQAKRDQVAMITEGSIQSKLQGNLPVVEGSMLSPKKSTLPIVVVAGLVAVVGYQFIKGK